MAKSKTNKAAAKKVAVYAPVTGKPKAGDEAARAKANAQREAARRAHEVAVQKAKQPPAVPETPAPQMAPPVTPFLNADDLKSLADFDMELSDRLRDIDRSFGDLSAQTTFDKTQTESASKQQSSNTMDAMIARGLFQSSVKDAAIYDIEAQRALQQKFLDDRLTRASLDADNSKKALDTWKSNFQSSLDQKAVENAREVEPVVNVAPPAGPAGTPAAPAPVATGSKPQPTTQKQPNTQPPVIARGDGYYVTPGGVNAGKPPGGNKRSSFSVSRDQRRANKQAAKRYAGGSP